MKNVLAAIILTIAGLAYFGGPVVYSLATGNWMPSYVVGGVAAWFALMWAISIASEW